ncbi:MAG: SCO family protein [Proteobacteria bacterium]|nr:SCO family protein [Pseudomonadota bacterium]
MIGIAAVAVLLTAIAAPGWAHSLRELESKLTVKERYMVVEEGPFPDFVLEDAGGRRVDRRDFLGKVMVLNFIYTECPDECPLHSELIAEIQAGVNRTLMKDLVAFVSITTDPENDTGEALTAYGPVHGLDAANWVFLTSKEPGATRKLAAGLRQKFTARDGGIFQHAIVTYLIDARGRLRARYFGLKFDPVNLIVHINGLLHEDHHEDRNKGGPEAPSLWERFMGLFTS